MPSTRPPPLELQHDNTQPNPGKFVAPKRARGPPARGRRRFEFWEEIQRANWRNVVIAVAGINALRFVIHAVNCFQDGQADKQLHAPRLAHTSCITGCLYAITAVIQVFGLLSTMSQRISLIRVYAYLSFLSALLIVIAGFVGAVSFFAFSDELVHECATLAVMGSVQTKDLFRGKPWKFRNPTPTIARAHCVSAWTRASISKVFSVVLFSFIPAAFFFLLVFMYYRQVTDPEHRASLRPKEPSNTNGIQRADDGNDGSEERRGRRRHRSVPVIHLNGTPLPQSDGHGGVVLPPKRFKSKSQSQSRKDQKKKRATVAVADVSSISPYNISPGPPSYAAAARECSYGYGDIYQPIVERTTVFGRSVERRSDSLDDTRGLV